jgi:hypothetical protein
VALLDQQARGTARAQAARVLEEHIGLALVHFAEDDDVVAIGLRRMLEE